MNLILDLKRYLLQFLDRTAILRLGQVNKEWKKICREPEVWYPYLMESNPASSSDGTDGVDDPYRSDKYLPKYLSWYLFSLQCRLGEDSLRLAHQPALIANLSSYYQLIDVDDGDGYLLRERYLFRYEDFSFELLYHGIKLKWRLTISYSRFPASIRFSLGRQIVWIDVVGKLLNLEEIFSRIPIPRDNRGWVDSVQRTLVNLIKPLSHRFKESIRFRDINGKITGLYLRYGKYEGVDLDRR